MPQSKKQSVRNIIRLLCEDGVMPSWGTMITPDELDYLKSHHPEWKRIDKLSGSHRKENTELLNSLLEV